MRHASFLAACALGMTLAAGAHAGGLVVAIEPARPLPSQAAQAADWAGGYVGGSLGYGLGGQDAVGFDRYVGDIQIGRDSNLAQADVDGLTAGLHAGYRWQGGRWIFGPELWFEGGSIDARDSVSPTGAIVVESGVNHLVGLQLKAGYAATRQMLVYGSAGAVQGDLDYALTSDDGSETVNYDATGYSLGLGVERRMRDRLSVFAEWQYRSLGETEVTFGDAAASVLTRATPSHHHLKLGVNFSF
ncbi:porin family protein [Paracoccus subflavus]|uniref:Porin family protein n=1 Tax=Paracoccus subflavus TaxID=2528244 RepID=A0A4Q9G1X9_9RHOB|nr:outer membrane beta-barrel protein [Paracoccus subflavus]TBN40338.1 porin family protein [Paracoccus subflavus]